MKLSKSLLSMFCYQYVKGQLQSILVPKHSTDSIASGHASTGKDCAFLQSSSCVLLPLHGVEAVLDSWVLIVGDDRRVKADVSNTALSTATNCLQRSLNDRIVCRRSYSP